MRGELNEQLSALVDDELRKDEADLLVRQLARSEELRARFGRYCLISEALQRNLSAATGSDLAERVARALEDEPTHGAGQQRRHSQAGLFLRPVAGMAFAAAGAMAMVVMWPQETPENAIQQAMPPVAAVQEQVMRPVAAVQGATVRSLQPIEAIETPGLVAMSNVVVEMSSSQRQWERLDPQVRRQLTNYLINHSARSATDQMDTALPYMRIIGHEASN